MFPPARTFAARVLTPAEHGITLKYMPMCLYPKLIKNKKYTSNKKNNGNVPEMKDKRVAYVPVGCGICSECLKQKSNNWKVRLKEEVKETRNGQFVTLSFSNESYRELHETIKKEEKKELSVYAMDNKIATLAVRRFLERWRKEHGKSIRHWLITELGEKNTERVHIHGIIWTDKKDDIIKHWKYGNVFIGSYVSERTINYVAKYITKTDIKHKYYKPVILASKGIGSRYTKYKANVNRNKYKDGKTIETYKDEKGYEMALPIYYKNKIYSEEEREKLWLEKLDKEVRYVKGEKVKVSDAKGVENYYKLLKWHRERDKQMGFGNPKDWEAAKYEKERIKL